MMLAGGRFTFAFGDWCVCVQSRHAAWMEMVESRYGDFRCHGEPDLTLVYRCRESTPMSAEEHWLARRVPLAHRSDGSQVLVTGDRFDARCDRELVVIDGPLATYPIDLVVMDLWRAARPRVVVFHGAGILVDGAGFVCLGPSGCGKTTLAGILGGDALCDEFVAVSVDEDRARIHGLPFWSGRPGSGPLVGIDVLQHGTRNERLVLSAAESARALVGQLVWPCHSPLIERDLDRCEALLGLIQPRRLRFLPNHGVKSMFDGGRAA